MEDPGTGDQQPHWPGTPEGTPAWPAPLPGTPGWGTPPSARPAGPAPTVPPAQPYQAYPPPQAPPRPAPAFKETVGIGVNTRCYQHPERLASSMCRSCNQPICTDCMVQAPVGWHCRRCVHRNAKTSPVIRYRPGAGGLTAPGSAPVTIALIALNAALFVVAAASPRLTSDSYMVPAAVQAGQWDRLFASFFVTNNVPDVALNMFSLLIIGRLVEPSLGKWRYLALYMLSGLGGSVASYLFSNPLQPSAGASGAIFGLFGAYFVLARRAALNTSGILSLIVINLVFSFVVPDINWLAHLGGLATGLVVAAGYGLARRRRQQRLVAVLTVVSVCAVLCLLLLLTPGQVVLLN